MLYMCLSCNVFNIFILFVDSLAIVNWSSDIFNLQTLSLVSWCSIVKDRYSSFATLKVHHVHIKFNMEGDALSKRALSYPEGFLIFEEFVEGSLIIEGIVNFFEMS